MCSICGCEHGVDHFHVSSAHAPLAHAREVTVMDALLRDNDRQAAHNRQHFDMAGVLVVNLMSSPGSGKTSLLEATIGALKGHSSVAVIEGDLQTDNDARRIRASGAPAVQITTGNACHLDANMVHVALHQIDIAPIDILFIENVGNLVCPACFDLGQHRNVVLLSVTEGDDKPEKYPVMFHAADLVIVTKLDLIEAVGDFRLDAAERHLRSLATEAPMLALSARSGVGIGAWTDWLIAEHAARGPLHEKHPHAAHV